MENIEKFIAEMFDIPSYRVERVELSPDRRGVATVTIAAEPIKFITLEATIGAASPLIHNRADNTCDFTDEHEDMKGSFECVYCSRDICNCFWDEDAGVEESRAVCCDCWCFWFDLWNKFTVMGAVL